MKKKIIYFFQSIIIYLFYFISKVLGLKLSRKLFSFLFIKVGKFLNLKKSFLKI